MVDIKRLLEYNEKVRHKYLKALAKLPWKEFVRNREASFHSLRNIFVHTLNAADYWLDFLLKENIHSRRKFDEYQTFKEVEAYMECVEARMRDYLNSVPVKGLEKKYMIKIDANKTVEITAEDVLIHMFEEEVHQRRIDSTSLANGCKATTDGMDAALTTRNIKG